MKKKLLLVFVALLMIVPLAACSSKGSDDAYRFGHIGPLSGAAAIYGKATDNGAKLAIDEINAAGGINGKQIEYSSQDDEHDAEKSVNAFNKLKDWNMQVLVGTTTTAPAIAVSDEAKASSVFMLTPSASSPDVVKGKDNVFQMCFTDPNQGTASADYISTQKLGSKIAIIYNNADAYSKGIYDKFKAEAAAKGLEVVSEQTFTDDTTDFSVQLQDAKSKDADLVFLPIYYTPASLILKQAADMQYAPKFFGVDGMDGILTLEGFDTKLAEGVMLLTPFSADATDELTVNFVKNYKEKYGETPNQFAADAYDCVYALKAAIEKAGVETTDDAAAACAKLVKVFNELKFDGLTGTGMTWTNGEVSKAPKGMIIKDGAYVGM